MVDSDVFQKFVEYPPENGTITKILYEYDMAAPINEHPDCSEQCLRDVEDLVKDPEDDVVDIKLCGTKIIKVEPDRYRAIREKTNYEDVPTHPNILKISHFTYHERTDCYVFVYDLGCEVTTLSEFVKTATLEDRKCLVEQVIRLVQHFHKHCILYGHLQPDLMYVVLSEKNRKPQLKVGSFLKTAFCDTRTEIPDFSGSCKEESTMLEDLKDAAHVIAFIYNQGDTARTANAADKVMKELQSMSLEIEESPTESVMLQIWSVLYTPDKTQSLVLVRFSSKNSQVEQPRIEILVMSTDYLKSERHQYLLRYFLEEVIVYKLQFYDKSFVDINKSCKYSSIVPITLLETGSTVLQPGIEIIKCLGCATTSTLKCNHDKPISPYTCPGMWRFTTDEEHAEHSEQTEEKRLQSFPHDWDVVHSTLYECCVLAKQGFRYLKDRNVIQLIIPCYVSECQFLTKMIKKLERHFKRFLDPWQTKRTLHSQEWISKSEPKRYGNYEFTKA